MNITESKYAFSFAYDWSINSPLRILASITSSVFDIFI